MYGSTNAHDVLRIAFGAMIAATIKRAPVASQIGRNRAATTPLASTESTRPARRVEPACAADPEALTSRPIPEGRTPKNVPRPGVHSVHVRRGVSTVTERVPVSDDQGRRSEIRGGYAGTRTQSGKIGDERC